MFILKWKVLIQILPKMDGRKFLLTENFFEDKDLRILQANCQFFHKICFSQNLLQTLVETAK